MNKYAKTVRAAAVDLGIDRGTLQKWFAMGCPRKGPRGLDLAAIQRWRDANLGDWNGAPERVPTADAARLKKAQADEREAKAALAALELKIRNGEFIPLDRVKERDVARIFAVKRGLLSFASSLAPRLVGLEFREIEGLLRTSVRDLLTKFSQM